MTKENATGTEQNEQPGQLSVVTTNSNSVRVVTVRGEIDYHNGESLRQALAPAADAAPRIVADMAGVTFIDSSGINILLAAHHTLTAAGCMAALTAPVLRTLQIVGIDTVIDFRETLHEAVTG